LEKEWVEEFGEGAKGGEDGVGDGMREKWKGEGRQDRVWGVREKEEWGGGGRDKEQGRGRGKRGGGWGREGCSRGWGSGEQWEL